MGSSPHPFHLESYDLSKVKLSRHQRIWIAQTIHNNILSIKQINQQFKISKSTLYYIANHPPFLKEKGRPTAIDSLGLSILRAKFAANVNVEEFIKRCWIKDEYFNSYQRRYKIANIKRLKMLSNRSVRRYLDILNSDVIVYSNNDNNDNNDDLHEGSIELPVRNNDSNIRSSCIIQ
jgi:hypothetical protein